MRNRSAGQELSVKTPQPQPTMLQPVTLHLDCNLLFEKYVIKHQIFRVRQPHNLDRLQRRRLPHRHHVVGSCGLILGLLTDPDPSD